MQTEDNIQQRRNCSCGFLDISDVTERRQSEISTSKRIQGACRVPSSLFTMTKACMNVASAASANLKSAKRKHNEALARLQLIEGEGIDINIQSLEEALAEKSQASRDVELASAAYYSYKNFKHGSYDRYLARLKGRGPLTTQPTNNVAPVKGNKSRMIGLMPNCTKSYFCGGN